MYRKTDTTNTLLQRKIIFKYFNNYLQNKGRFCFLDKNLKVNKYYLNYLQ